MGSQKGAKTLIFGFFDFAKTLTDLIMEQFEHDGMAFHEWSAKIHDDIIESLLEDAELDTIDRPVAIPQQQQPAVVKILKWDPGKYLRIFIKLATNNA